jgi:poly-gamma-glutamate biosynthesis protein PgsC/CapC
MTEIAIALGIFSGLGSYELLGFSAGGFVTPGYLALYADQPLRVAATVLAALLTFAAMRLASRWLVLFGTRRYAVTLLAGFLLKALMDAVLLRAPIALPELRVIGYIVPGLIANDMERQGLLPTLSMLAVCSAVVYLVLLAVRALSGGA